MAGIALTDPRRSQLLSALLEKQLGQQPNIQSGGELGIRLLAQVLQQKNIDKLQGEEAGRAKTISANEVAALAKMQGAGDMDFGGRPVSSTPRPSSIQDGPQNNNISLAQALGQLPEGNSIKDAISGQMIKQSFTPPAEPKPPPSRNRIEGPDTVFEEWNPQTLQYEEKSRGPRTQVIEQTTFDGSALTGSAISKTVVDAREATEQTARQIRQATRSVEIAQKNPAAIGIPGNIVTFGNNMVRTASALGTLLKDDKGNAIDLEPNRSQDRFNWSGMRHAAADNAEFRAGIYGIAFAAAVATQGSRPTDKDIQAFIDQIAGSSSDPIAFSRTINGFTRLTVAGLRDTIALNPEIDEEEAARLFAVIDPLMEKFDKQIGGDEQNARIQKLKEMGLLN